MAGTETGIDAIRKMFAAFGNADAKRALVYIEALSQFPAAVVAKACRKVVLEQKFLPTVSEIVQAIKSLMSEMDESRRTKGWAEAWGEIEKAMRSHGCTGRTPTFSTREITATVVAIGGIDVLAMCETRNFNTLRAQVKAIYESMCQRAAEREVNAYILGDDRLLLPNNGEALKLTHGKGGMQSVGEVLHAA